MPRRFLSVALAFIFLAALLPGCAKTDEFIYGLDGEPLQYHTYVDIPGITAQEIMAIEMLRMQNEYFNYGVLSNTEAFVGIDGQINGFAALFCEWLTELFDIPFVPRHYAWADMLTGLETGEIHFVGNLTATEERRQSYQMTDAIAQRTVMYFRLAGSEDLSLIRTKRLPRYAMLEGSATANHVIANAIDEFELIYIPEYIHAYELLQSREIDALIAENTVESVFYHIDDIVTENFFPLIYAPVSFTTQSAHLAPIISVVQKALQHDALPHLAELYNLGYRQYLHHKLFMQLTPEEIAFIQSDTPIRLAAEYDNYPVSFYNTYEQKFDGIAFDVLYEIEKLTGLSFVLTNDQYTEWPELIKKLEDGEVSIITELIYSAEREGMFLWPTISNVTDYYALLSKSDFHNIGINEILHLRVGVARDTAYTEVFRRWFPNHLHTIEYETLNLMYEALENGEIDAAMASQNQLLGLTHFRELAGFKANFVFDRTYDSTFGFNKDEELLCSIVDKALRLVDTNSIAIQWTRRTYDYRIKLAQAQMQAQRPWLFGASALLLCIIILMFTMFQRKHHEGRRLQLLVDERTIKLNEAIKRATAASQAKSDFLAKVSHEIRTPMNAIIGMAELALREELPPQTYEQVSTIRNSGANLLAIINDILDFSKIESGKLEINPTGYLLSSLLNDVISTIRMRVIDVPVRFVVNIDSSLPNALFGDEIRLRQILINILSNAVKYTDEGYVSFTVMGETDKQADILTLSIEVTDSGRGIKPEDINKLYSEFVQLDVTENKGIEGTGLGLAITMNLVKAMNGEISVESEYGAGSTFAIVMPQGVRSHERIAVVQSPQEKSVLIYETREIFANSIVCSVDNLGVSCTMVYDDSAFIERLTQKQWSFVFISSALYKNVKQACTDSGTKIVLLTEFGEAVQEKTLSTLAMPVHCISVANILNDTQKNYTYNETGRFSARFTAPDARVLVVDDVTVNLKVAEGLLSPYKTQVVLCKSGEEALKMIQKTSFDIAFMDHMMPEMDGIETTKRIREMGYKLPIVALSANAVTGVEEIFSKNGFNDFLSKPIDTTKLNMLLEKWIPRQKQVKASTQSKADTQAAIASIEGLNTKKGIRLTGGSSKGYIETLHLFVHDGNERIPQIKACLKNEELLLYTTHTHALKAAAATIGADALSELASALEQAGEQQDLAYMREHTDHFLAELEALISRIKQILSAGETTADLDMEVFKTELIRLKTALSDFDTDTIDDATRCLQPFVRAGGMSATVGEVLQLLLMGSYEEAASRIDTLLKEGSHGTNP